MTTQITEGYVMVAPLTGMYIDVYKVHTHVGYRYLVRETFKLEEATILNAPRLYSLDLKAREALGREYDSRIEYKKVRITRKIELV